MVLNMLVPVIMSLQSLSYIYQSFINVDVASYFTSHLVDISVIACMQMTYVANKIGTSGSFSDSPGLSQ